MIIPISDSSPLPHNFPNKSSLSFTNYFRSFFSTTKMFYKSLIATIRVTRSARLTHLDNSNDTVKVSMSVTKELSVILTFLVLDVLPDV